MSPETTATTTTSTADDVKACCATLYERSWVRLLLGDSFHPGGAALTRVLGQRIGLGPTDHVLDVACGPGTSALVLAKEFGCRVTGTDLSAGLVAQANEAARAQGMDGRVKFEVGDAERLPYLDAAFTAVMCECAFCTFPDKATGASELRRVLRPGGRLGMSDLALDPARLPPSLHGLMAKVACLADARPLAEYVATFEDAGFTNFTTEDAREALLDMIRQIDSRLLFAQIAVGLKKLDVAGVDLRQGKRLLGEVRQCVQDGVATYALWWGTAAIARPALRSDWNVCASAETR